MELRSTSLGDENFYLAINYSNMVMLGVHRKWPMSKVQQYYEKGHVIYKKLAEQMKK
jgi:hypothetical protein